jgi:hypothetical protein
MIPETGPDVEVGINVLMAIPGSQELEQGSRQVRESLALSKPCICGPLSLSHACHHMNDEERPRDWSLPQTLCLLSPCMSVGSSPFFLVVLSVKFFEQVLMLPNK